LHDMLAGTVVVDVPDVRPAPHALP
jgi:hypothetical protein